MGLGRAFEGESDLVLTPKDEGAAPDVAEQPLGRRERKKAEVRKRLYEAAMELFQELGFEDTTIEQITDRVDVSTATFFNYFPTKESVLSDYYRVTNEGWMEWSESTEFKTVRERVLGLADWQERHARKEGKLFGILLKEALTHPETFLECADVAMRALNMFGDWVTTAQTNGEIRADLDPRLVVRTIGNTMNGAMLEWASGSAEKLGDHTIRQRVELLFDGLEPR